MLRNAEHKTGDFLRTFRDASFEWRLRDILSLPAEEETNYLSDEFHFSDSSWCLNLYQSCNSGEEKESWVDIGLTRRNSGYNTNICFTLGIKKADNMVEIIMEDDIHFMWKECGRYGRNRFLGRSELLRRRSELVPSGVFTIVCTLMSNTQYSMEVSLFGRLWNLSRRWKKIFFNEESSDVLLKLKNCVIAAHSLVLQSRSAVFRRMLDSDMKESRTGVIELVDDDEDTLDVVLSYIYSGEPEELSPENACTVYKIAHKYDLQELRKLCCVFLEQNLSVDTMCEVVAMSHMYEDEEMKKRAKDYFAKNVKKVVETEDWKALKRENLPIAAELLEHVAFENAPENG